MSRSTLVLSLLVLATAACGAPAPPTAPPSAPPTPAAGARVVLVEQDAGRTIVVARGTTVELQLQERLSAHPAPATTSLRWDVSSSAPSVLLPAAVTRQVNPGGRFDVYVADFSARSTGSARLVARGTQTCEAVPSDPCTQPSLTFDVVVH